jgi:ferredoxin--NADP+ reductase
MIDGTGMCGGCRVLVGGKSKFACVDGPEFDAHEVDFDVLLQRNSMYRGPERESMAEFERDRDSLLEAIRSGCAESCVLEGEPR